MDVKAINEAKTALQKAVDTGKNEEVIDIIAQLKKGVKPTEALLRDTRIGVAVGKLRTHKSDAVARAAKELVGVWRNVVKPAEAKPSPSTAATPSGKSATPSAPMSKTNSQATTGASPSMVRNVDTDGVASKVMCRDDRTRNQCIKLMYDGLAFDQSAPSEIILKCAMKIDEEMYNNVGKEVNKTYRDRMRGLLLNLKDKKNPALREAVLNGSIKADRLVIMKPDELASEEKKQEAQQIKEHNLFLAQSAAETGAVTDLFQCGKCKERKVSYYQMQTRSADEPMTTFCRCIVCGNRWKFS
ncbi:transcription elongation factor TFIIS [Saitoella coloradoensis]